MKQILIFLTLTIITNQGITAPYICEADCDTRFTKTNFFGFKSYRSASKTIKTISEDPDEAVSKLEELCKIESQKTRPDEQNTYAELWVVQDKRELGNEMFDQNRDCKTRVTKTETYVLTYSVFNLSFDGNHSYRQAFEYAFNEAKSLCEIKEKGRLVEGTQKYEKLPKQFLANGDIVIPVRITVDCSYLAPLGDVRD